ncbi:bcl-2-like protein 1 [Denticeps clupeoides]|uniref:Bcl-2-like protein 1 n=1 Tax=Denticeps clupeoides TaxID=299321 RepID=A0AAY4ASB4_9TELE|nr:bcl-2-like protein 1 [Denticeps clupeoides]
MSYSNRELVVYYINYKLSQRNYPLSHVGLTHQMESPVDSSQEGAGVTALSNGSVNGTSALPASAELSPLLSPVLSGNGSGGGASSSSSIDAVKEALRDSANEFELRYSRAFSDLSSQLHITPATAYQSFESVMDEVFRDGVNWGRVVGLFAFGGALCVECVEKEMSPLVARIADWMTVYLDNHIQPWIQSQGGWDRFAEIFGKDTAAESRRSQESFKNWLVAGMTLVTGVVVGSLIVRKHL